MQFGLSNSISKITVMRPKFKTIFTALAIVISFQSEVLGQFITFKKTPNSTGQREATATVKLMGLPPDKVRVSIVYGTDSIEVKNAFIPNKRNPSKYYETQATLTDLRDGSVEASAIFPHSGTSKNNREYAFEHGKRIYYAWARTHIPTGATEELTVNSEVKGFKMPRPFTIAYMGDSYASGEGAKGPGNWLNEPCHRSNNSGGVLAIKKLIAQHPEFEFDYVNTTCSGAKVVDFFVSAQPVEPNKNPTKQDKQIDIVQRWMIRNQYQELDFLLADGGGNDIGFGNLVADGLTSFFQELRTDKKKIAELNRALNNLPDIYDSFMVSLEQKINPSKIIWMNYPNPLIGEGGRLCYQDFSDPGDCWGILENQIADEDWVFINENIFNKLNQRVKNAATKHGWDLADVSQKAIGFGICNCDGYFNTLGQSNDSQDDHFGTLHPNARGYNNIYKETVFKKLDSNLDALLQEQRRALIEDAKERAKAKILLQKSSN